MNDLTLERFRLAELPADEAARVAAQVGSDPELQARLSALSASDHDLHERGLVRQLEHRVMTGAGAAAATTASRLGSWRLTAFAAAAVVLVAAIVWGPGSGGADRIKGEPASLILYRKSDAGSESLSDGTRARQGDLIRVAYRSVNLCFGVIVSIDGRGTVTRHLPGQGEGAATIQPGDAVPLDTAYELDDAPKWERFYLVTGERAFEVKVVMDAARRAAAVAGNEPPETLPLPPELRQTSFLLRKVS